MKGVIFTEFLELVEDKFGFEIADKIVTNSNLPSGGSYTAVGTYDHMEMVSMVTELSKESGISVNDLLYTYGKYLFSRFPKLYPQFFEKQSNAIDFLESIEEYIHKEVRKLYPDAELPYFETDRKGEEHLEMMYSSKRNMPDVAHGLIDGCLAHFNLEAKTTQKTTDKGTLFIIKGN